MRKLSKLSDLIVKELDKIETSVPGPEWQTRKEIAKAIDRSVTQTDRILKDMLDKGIAEMRRVKVDGYRICYYKMASTLSDKMRLLPHRKRRGRG